MCDDFAQPCGAGASLASMVEECSPDPRKRTPERLLDKGAGAIMFSATEAAFSGFRAGREHVRTLLAWIPLLAVASLLMSAAMVVFGGPGLEQLEQLASESQPDPQAMLAAAKPLAGFYVTFLAIAVVYYGIVAAAVNRMMLRPGDRRMAYFALGADELRQVAVILLLTLAYSLVYVVGLVAVIALAAAASAVHVALGVVVGLAGGLGLAALLVVVAVRWSLASAQTFATGRINLFGSWSLTRGQFWPMLGSYLLAFILAIIANAAVLLLLMLAMVVFGGGFSALGPIMSPDMTSLQTYFTPSLLLYELIGAIPAPFLLLIMMCPAPDIYRSLVGRAGPAG